MKIDDPKTPYHEYDDEDDENEKSDKKIEVDPVVLGNLEEASKNRDLNAKQTSNVKR